jgi:hypothetical protein
MAPKFKTISKVPVEACSVWKALDIDNGELSSFGFVLFRKATAKDPPGRKLIALTKYKARLSTEADGAGKFFLGEDEIDVEQSKKYQDILETLIALP